MEKVDRWPGDAIGSRWSGTRVIVEDDARSSSIGDDSELIGDAIS